MGVLLRGRGVQTLTAHFQLGAAANQRDIPLAIQVNKQENFLLNELIPHFGQGLVACNLKSLATPCMLD